MNKYTLVAIFFIGLFTVVSIALYVTNNPWCLLALLTPIHINDCREDNNEP